MRATATKGKRASELVEELEKIERQLSSAADEGEALEAELEELQRRAEAARAGQGWLNDAKVPIEKRAEEVQQRLETTRRRFKEARERQAELLDEARSQLEESYRQWTKLELERRRKVAEVLSQIRELLRPAVEVAEETATAKREAEMLKGVVSCKRIGPRQSGGCLSPEQLRGLIDSLEEKFGVGPGEDGADQDRVFGVLSNLFAGSG